MNINFNSRVAFGNPKARSDQPPFPPKKSSNKGEIRITIPQGSFTAGSSPLSPESATKKENRKSINPSGAYSPKSTQGILKSERRREILANPVPPSPLSPGSPIRPKSHNSNSSLPPTFPQNPRQSPKSPRKGEEAISGNHPSDPKFWDNFPVDPRDGEEKKHPLRKKASANLSKLAHSMSSLNCKG